MSVPLMTTDPAADDLRRRRLRRMRSVAVGLLLLAAVVYLLTVGREGVLGYVNAGAEASMVGAIADWFAVTALFRHPLGLPIPHTALIPRRKDDLGRSLEEFVGENFLVEGVIRERLADAAVARRLGEWIHESANAERVVAEAAEVLNLGLRRVREQDVAAIVLEVILPRLQREPIAPLAGALLQGVVEDRAHHGLVDLVLEEVHRWLLHNQDVFAEVIGQRAPWWAPESLNERVIGRLHLELVRWVDDIRRDPDHRVRGALDAFLAQLAQDLLTDPVTAGRAERLKTRLLEQPQLVITGMALWETLRQALVDALDDPTGPLRERAAAELVAFADRLRADHDLQGRIDARGADLVVFGVRRYGRELTSVITQTVRRWDGREAAARIELHVGRDLQFIRINGTVVGGLVGLVIHAVSQVVG